MPHCSSGPRSAPLKQPNLLRFALVLLSTPCAAGLRVPAPSMVAATWASLCLELDDAVPVRDFKMTVYDGEPSR